MKIHQKDCMRSKMGKETWSDCETYLKTMAAVFSATMYGDYKGPNKVPEWVKVNQGVSKPLLTTKWLVGIILNASTMKFFKKDTPPGSYAPTTANHNNNNNVADHRKIVSISILTIYWLFSCS